MKIPTPMKYINKRRHGMSAEYIAVHTAASRPVILTDPITGERTNDYSIDMEFGFLREGGGNFPDGRPMMREYVEVRLGEAISLAAGIIAAVLQTESKDVYVGPGRGYVIKQSLSESWSDFPMWLNYLRKLVNEAAPSMSVADPISSRIQVSDQREGGVS